MRLHHHDTPGTAPPRARSISALAALVLCAAGPGAASAGATVFRCPGNPAVFTSDARLASAKGCESLDRRAVVAGPAPVSAAREPDAAGARAPIKAVVVAVQAPAHANVVPRTVQNERDNDRKRILQDELARERGKLQALGETLTKARAQPESAAEVERLSQVIRRTEGDIESIGRELALAGR
jgi:hypothetical protein